MTGEWGGEPAGDATPGEVTLGEVSLGDVTPDGFAPANDGAAEAPPPLLERVGILRLGSVRLGVAGTYCSSLLQIEDLTPLPGSPAHILGVTSVRGRIVPVFDLGVSLGLDGREDRPADGRSLEIGLVVEADGLTGVLAAEEVVAFEVFDLRQQAETATGAPASLGRFAHGLLRHRGHDVVLLEIPPLLEAMRIPAGSELRPEFGPEATTL